MRTHSSLFFLLLLCSGYSYAQRANLRGTVVSQKGTPIVGAHVKWSRMVVITDVAGEFTLPSVSLGNQTLQISSLGFETLEKEVQVSGDSPTPVRIVLAEATTTLEEITVRGTSTQEILRASTASVSLLETKAFAHRSVATGDLLNTLPGVQVRHSGGLGNQVDVSLHGLRGRQVRFFVDQVPLDFLLPVDELGLGMALSLLPVNNMERIEVYKGAVPVSLGADALGGAVHFVTRNALSDYLDITTERSSFNTWRHSLNAQKVFNSGLMIGLSGFYSASDNDYRLDEVTVINEFGNPELISTTKFHDRFVGRLVKGQVGIVGKPWAERLVLTLSYGDVYDEIQHNFEMRQPYGQALNLATTYNAGLHYENYGIADRWDVQAYVGFNQILTEFVDTTLNIYDWRGDVLGRKTFGGEITSTQSHLQLTGYNWASRLGIAYHLTEDWQVDLNAVWADFSRTGVDPVLAQTTDEDYYQQPVYQTKGVLGLGLTYGLTGVLQLNTALKGYVYRAQGFIVEDGEAIRRTQSQMQPGIGQSLRWQITPNWRLKASYEYATRMPDRLETMGDFSAAINANPDLRPETSHNLNLGGQFAPRHWRFEVNGFFRSVENIIILQAVPPPVLSTYENLLKARIMGAEAEVSAKPWPWLSATVNVTYQDMRNRSEPENAGVSSDRYFDARLPNQPYFFGNADVQFTQEDFLNSQGTLQAWWSTAYVEGFFRYWEIDGRPEDKLTVPDQWLHHVGLAYTTWQDRITVSLESQNVFDSAAFDNFRVQKPGRSWHAKLRFYLTKP
ncbi:MAG: TonB-dependent receptor [Bacteroidota bacterium]